MHLVSVIHVHRTQNGTSLKAGPWLANPTWRGRGLSKLATSRVIIRVTPFRALITLLITYLLSPLPLQVGVLNFRKHFNLTPSSCHLTSRCLGPCLQRRWCSYRVQKRLVVTGILNPKPQTLNPKPWTLNPKPWTLNPKPWTLNPKTLNPKPWTQDLLSVPILPKSTSSLRVRA